MVDDMLLSEEQYSRMFTTQNDVEFDYDRNACAVHGEGAGCSDRWGPKNENGKIVIPYEIDDGLPPEVEKIIEQAAEEFKKKTVVQ